MTVDRTQVSDETILMVLEAFTRRLGQRLEKHGRGAFLSVHEGFGVYEEEHWELVQEVRKHPHDLNALAEEYFDCAVASVFAVASMIGAAPVKAEPEVEPVVEVDTEQQELVERAAKSGIIISSDLIS